MIEKIWKKKLGRLGKWYGVLWSLWCHRIKIVVNDESLDFDAVVEIIRYRACAWISAKWKNASFLFYEWYVNPAWCLKSIQ